MKTEKMRLERGLLLVVMTGLLTLILILAVVFTALARTERGRTSAGTVEIRAKLLARSGLEYAIARLLEPGSAGLPPVFSNPEEDWRFRDDPAVSLEQSRNPSYNADPYTDVDLDRKYSSGDLYDDPDGNRAYDGWSGRLRGSYADYSNRFRLRIQNGNAKIHINGGALDERDRDPDGPGADPSMFPLNPAAAAEAGPLRENGIPDHRDASGEGPNGWLVRLLNHLERILHGDAAGFVPTLGKEIVENRPAGGYRSLEDLKSVLGEIRFELFQPYLTLYAFVDPKVVKPQPMNGRPHRWRDIDDAHRTGISASEISGVRTSGGGDIRLNPSSSPWTQTITVTNGYEGTREYPVTWERNFIYAQSQLRPAPIELEPRAPIDLNAASPEVSASVFLGLKGTWLDVWDGSAGWDGGFGWYTKKKTIEGVEGAAKDTVPFGLGGAAKVPAAAKEPQGTYSYPSQATEETPWHRTRVDYGMTYGDSTEGARPWYGPSTYAPHASSYGGGGKPVIQSAPLGRLKETVAVSPEQARAIVEQARLRIDGLGSFRTWGEFRAFLDLLPRWEDLNRDGVLDGEPYTVTGSRGAYARREYYREDRNSDGVMTREVFSPTAGTSWKVGAPVWLDFAVTGTAGLSMAHGLTFPQKDVLEAMANPNTGLNDFNPDANLWKEVDKTDLAGIESDADAYVHTTELSLGDTGYFSVDSLGEVFERGRAEQRAAGYSVSSVMELFGSYRDTTQADFMRAWHASSGEEDATESIFKAPLTPYLLAGGQPLVSYPEPLHVANGQRGADAFWDGQVSLGFVGAEPLTDETLRGDLFDSVDATATDDPEVMDLRGPYQEPLLSLTEPGNVFPDGVYSEKDRSLKYPMAGNIIDHKAWTTDPRYAFYASFWVKPGWFPEASPRAHSLVSLSRGLKYEEVSQHAFRRSGDPGYGVVPGYVPLDNVRVRPVGLYFVPARNNFWEDVMGVYDHAVTSTMGGVWPRRSLLWGTTHSLFGSDCLNRHGVETPPVTHPVGRLEGRRWVHLAVLANVPLAVGRAESWLIVGRVPASTTGGGWNWGFGVGGTGVGAYPYTDAVWSTHMDADQSPNHLRFGEIAGEHNMNYTADATFAGVRAGGREFVPANNFDTGPQAEYRAMFTDAGSPAVLGRYLKEDGATYLSSRLSEGLRPLRITWTEIPCRLWFDENRDGWLGDPPAGAGVSPDVRTQVDYRDVNGRPPGAVSKLIADGSLYSSVDVNDPSISAYLNTFPYGSRDDQFGAESVPGPDGLRDVRVDLEIWDDMRTEDHKDDSLLLRSNDPSAGNRIPKQVGRIYYKAVFVNQWDEITRLNHSLDVTPFLDDVTITYVPPGGPTLLRYTE